MVNAPQQVTKAIMIKEVTMYTVVCDGCGRDVNEGREYSCWNHREFAEDIAIASNWIKTGDKHYCSDCYGYDYDDNFVIVDKPPSPSPSPNVKVLCVCGGLVARQLKASTKVE